MNYDQYRYLYPPRPETAASPTTLHNYEKMGWWAQAKMNGTCTTLYVPPHRNSSFAMGRAGPDNKLVWQPGQRWLDFQENLTGPRWYVFVGELLHSKGVGVRDTIYLFDLLVDNGEYLIGQTYRERFARLVKVCEQVEVDKWSRDVYHTNIMPGVWLVNNYTKNFNDWFKKIRALPGKPAVEGLVFKNPEAKLLPCGTASANAKWQHKCRVATDHLSF